jgi:hypothetical protein
MNTETCGQIFMRCAVNVRSKAICRFACQGTCNDPSLDFNDEYQVSETVAVIDGRNAIRQKVWSGRQEQDEH